MKISYIVAILAIIMLVGCATPQPAAPEEPAAPPEVPAETPPAVPDASAETVAEVQNTAATEGEIAITKAGFDPSELTVKIGSTLTLKAVEGDHKLTIGGASTPVIKEGTGYDAKFDKVGDIVIFDILTKKSAIVTVTE